MENMNDDDNLFFTLLLCLLFSSPHPCPLLILPFFWSLLHGRWKKEEQEQEGEGEEEKKMSYFGSSRVLYISKRKKFFFFSFLQLPFLDFTLQFVD